MGVLGSDKNMITRWTKIVDAPSLSVANCSSSTTNVYYNGACYRTLDSVAPSSSNYQYGRQSQYFSLPDGWVLAPYAPDMWNSVVRYKYWQTRNVVHAGGIASSTYSSIPGLNTGWLKVSSSSSSSLSYKPMFGTGGYYDSQNSRILLLQPLLPNGVQCAPRGVLTSMPVASLLAYGCTEQMNVPYTQVWSRESVCALFATQTDGVIMVGAQQTRTGHFTQAAFGSAKKVLASTQSDTIAQLHNDAFWYFTETSFGFSDADTINLKQHWDAHQPSSEMRLSWMLSGGLSNYGRAGSTNGQSAAQYRKVLYFCPSTSMVTC
jgi:hypothetical protein